MMDATVALSEFQAFLQEEMKSRAMSMREFADVVGVSHSTISRALEPGRSDMPTLEFLSRLAKATGIDICTLVRMVTQESSGQTAISPAALALAQRINRLPESVQKFLHDYIIGAALGGVDSSDDKN